MTERAIVVGAGLAGLAAAVSLAAAGRRVELIEAAAQAGGRCRSWFDAALERTIDNGNHLLLSGNHAALAYLAEVGAPPLCGTAEAAFPFVEVLSGERWTVRPNAGPVPWWLLRADRRAAGTLPADYLAFAPLLWARRGRTLAQTVPCRGPVWDRLLKPLLLAALNTQPETGSAALAGAVLRESLARGGRYARPLIATGGLSAAFVDPALAWLAGRGAKLRLGTRVRSLAFEQGRLAALEIAGGRLEIGGAPVVLAVPPWIAADLVPGLVVPDAFSAIVNAHFAHPAPTAAPPMTGLMNATAEWVFAFPDRISITVSAGDRLLDWPAQTLAATFWADVSRVFGDLGPLPAWRIVKERRASFVATPAQEARRPGAAMAHPNLFLAGDYTATGLPATIEGAIRSGRRAARLALAATSRS